jgi:molybdenum cofactor cytidylyltransferase
VKYMNLKQALRLSDTPCLALVGAGGKTTALFQLARELPPPVIVTATTHLHVDQIKLADSHWVGEKLENLIDLEDNLCGVMLITGPVDGDRTKGLDKHLMSRLRAVCDDHALPLLIEADGSRQHPLKAPAEHEPPIPEFVETVVVVAGLSGLGKPLTEKYVHRVGRFRRLVQLPSKRVDESPGEEIITPKMIVKVLTHPEGGLKNIPAKARRVALLNQADTPELQSIGGKMTRDLLAAFDAVLVGTLEHSNLQTFERTAGIVLAAGESRRFGQPKQLLDYHGQPFVRTVAQTALSAGLSPVIVVTGANAGQVEAAIHDLPITINRNPDWKDGQSTSLKTGLEALPGEIGAAIFLLADQPQVTPTVLRALVEQHSADLAPIVAPLVAGQRANPVLFDRVTFPDLLALTGDVGGRAIFSKYPVNYLPWHDEDLLVDVDTKDDYQNLKERREWGT